MTWRENQYIRTQISIDFEIKNGKSIDENIKSFFNKMGYNLNDFTINVTIKIVPKNNNITNDKEDK